MTSLWQNIVICMDVLYLISTGSASYFLNMSMLISLVCTFIQARMGVGRATFLSKGAMRGQFFFLIAKHNNLYGRFIFPFLFPPTQSLIFLTRLCLLVW